MPTNAATRSSGNDSENAHTNPASPISPDVTSSDDRRPKRSANRPMRMLASTDPAAATASSSPTRAGDAPSAVSMPAISTLVQPYPSVQRPRGDHQLGITTQPVQSHRQQPLLTSFAPGEGARWCCRYATSPGGTTGFSMDRARRRRRTVATVTTGSSPSVQSSDGSAISHVLSTTADGITRSRAGDGVHAHRSRPGPPARGQRASSRCARPRRRRARGPANSWNDPTNTSPRTA